MPVEKSIAMKKYLIGLTLASMAFLPSFGQDFFSNEKPDKIFNLGVRVGINTSNRTLSNTVATIWNHNSWGTGFDAGIVADINIRNFVSIQPGFFYESRSGAYTYQNSNFTPGGDHFVYTQVGKGREYLFTIPVVASFHFNIIDELRWNVDFGPYFQFKLKSTFDHKFEYPEATLAGAIQYTNDVKTSRCDVGLKMGTGFDIFTHYYVGVHYLAGMCHPWNPGKLGGHNKEWMFTVGYNF